MSTTRAAILRRAMSLVPTLAYATVDGTTALTMSGAGSATTVVDTANQLPGGYSTLTHKNWFMSRPAMLSGTAGQKAADKVRVISSYAPSTNTWTVGAPNYAITPASTEPYRITKNHPSIWEKALNEALQTECFFLRFNNFTPTSQTQRWYTLGVAPLDAVTDLDRGADIHTIQWHSLVDISGEEDWRDWYNGHRTWEATEVPPGTVIIDFGPSLKPDTTMQMRLVVTRPFAALTDETTTSLVDVEWAAFATLLCMGRQLADMQNPKNEWTMALNNLAVGKFVADRRRAELGRYSRRTVERTTSRAGGAGIGGRAGARGGGVRIGRHGQGL